MPSTIASVINNDDHAFIVSVYKNYFGLVKRTVLKLTGSHSDVDDLINDCFLKLVEKTRVLRELRRGQLTTYIKFTARSVCINYIKHKEVVTKHVDTATDMEMAGNSSQPYERIDDKLIQKNELERLSKAILKLPEKQKNILYFKYFLEMSDEQISKIYSISADSVRTYVSRARKDARKMMFEGINHE